MNADSAAESGAEASPIGANGPSFRQLIRIRPGFSADPSGCVWLMGGLPGGNSADLRAAAWLLADDAMKLRCGASPAYGLWKTRATTRAPHPSEEDRAKIEPFVQDAFGLPGRQVPDDHLEGYVAELIWHRVISETGTSADGLRRLSHLEDLGFSVSEPGGDGLAVYEVNSGMLVFRLWEIKKHVASRHVSTTIARAYQQVNSRALSYLAKFTGIGRGYSGALGRLFAELVDLWIEGDQRAGVGISVATSEAHAPQRRAFSGMAGRFPRLSADGQREGLIAAIGDYRNFAQLVKELVWSGL